jgi:hypothetical protein
VAVISVPRGWGCGMSVRGGFGRALACIRGVTASAGLVRTERQCWLHGQQGMQGMGAQALTLTHPHHRPNLDLVCGYGAALVAALTLTVALTVMTLPL